MFASPGGDPKRRSPILIAEDEENDILLLKHAFSRAGICNPCVLARDGNEAITYLKTCFNVPGDEEPGTLPCLVLTDLKMPGMNGFDLLAWVRAQEHLRNIPAIVLSSSTHEADVTRALGLGANAYRVKPADFAQFVELVRDLYAEYIEPHCGVK